MRKTTKFTAISKSVKEAVRERDRGRCIICGKPGEPNAHFIPRSQMGKGVEENVVTLCYRCHADFDQSIRRKAYAREIERYLKSIYPGWNAESLTYRKD